MTRHDGWLAELQPALFFEIDPELAADFSLRTLDWIIVESPRGAMEGRALVTSRLRPLPVGNTQVHIVGVPMHFGYRGEVVGDSVNVLSPMSLGLNSDIASVKSFVCRLRPGRLPRAGGNRAARLDRRAPVPQFSPAAVEWICLPEGMLDDDCA